MYYIHNQTSTKNKLFIGITKQVRIKRSNMVENGGYLSSFAHTSSIGVRKTLPRVKLFCRRLVNVH